MSQDTIEQIFSNMINYFRTEIEKLNEHEKECIQRISSLSKPCQLHVISSFDHNRYLLIKTHLPEIEDKLIHVTQLKQSGFATQLKELIEDLAWLSQKNELEPNHNIYPYPDELARAIIQFGRSVYQSTHYRTTTNYHGFGLRMLIKNQVAIWEFLGKIEEWDFKKEVNRSVSGYKQDAVTREQKTIKNNTVLTQSQLPVTEQPALKNEQVSKRLSGFGTCFYPPILMGELTFTVEDQIFQKYEKLAKNVHVTKINNMVVAVSKGGLLGVQTHDPEEAEKALNTIMAVTLISGLPVYFVRKSEIADIYFEKDTLEMHASQWMVPSIRMQMFSSLVSPGIDHQEGMKTQISLSDLELIMKYCKKIWNVPENQKFLELLLNGYTFLENDSYSQSFLTSWTIIELHLYGLWAGKLTSAGVTRGIRENLNRWYLHHVLEILHVDKLITKDDYHNLKGLQKLRNDVMHEGYMITKEQAKECYRIASTFVKEKIGITDVACHIRTVYY